MVTALGVNHYSHHFIDEETDVYRAKVFAPGHTMNKRQSYNVSPNILASVSMVFVL